jgi:hypothetical protein
MGLSLKDPETVRRIRDLAARKGLGITATIKLAVDNEFGRDEAVRRGEAEKKIEAVRAIQQRWNRHPPIDMKAVDDWLYDENGAPH